MVGWVLISFKQIYIRGAVDTSVIRNSIPDGGVKI